MANPQNVALLALADTFHDFPEATSAKVREYIDEDIAHWVGTNAELATLFAKPSNIEDKLEMWFVRHKHLRSSAKAPSESYKYDAVMRTQLWKFYCDKEINLGRTGKRSGDPTLMFAEKKPTEAYQALLRKLSGKEDSLLFVIDRTKVPEVHYCGPNSSILWGDASSYDQYQRIEDKIDGYKGCIEPSSLRVQLTKQEGALFELDKIVADPNTPLKLVYEHRNNSKKGTIHLDYLIDKKGHTPKGLTLFRKGIQRLLAAPAPKRRRTEEALSGGGDNGGDGNGGDKGGVGNGSGKSGGDRFEFGDKGGDASTHGGALKRKRSEEIVEDSVYTVLAEGFSLMPPEAYSEQRAYVRTLFDFKRIMDMLQVKMADAYARNLGRPPIFVTYDRMACMFARLLQQPVLLQRDIGRANANEDNEAENVPESADRDKGIVFFPGTVRTLTNEDYLSFVDLCKKDYIAPLLQWEAKKRVIDEKNTFDLSFSLLTSLGRFDPPNRLDRAKNFLARWRSVYVWRMLAYISYLNVVYPTILSAWREHERDTPRKQYEFWAETIRVHNLKEQFKLTPGSGIARVREDPRGMIKALHAGKEEAPSELFFKDEEHDDFIRVGNVMQMLAIREADNLRNIDPVHQRSIADELRELHLRMMSNVKEASQWWALTKKEGALPKRWDGHLRAWLVAMKPIQSGGASRVALSRAVAASRVAVASKAVVRPVSRAIIQPVSRLASRPMMPSKTKIVVSGKLVARLPSKALNPIAKIAPIASVVPPSLQSSHPAPPATRPRARPQGWFLFPREEWAARAKTRFEHVIAAWGADVEPTRIWIPKHLFFAIHFLMHVLHL